MLGVSTAAGVINIMIIINSAAPAQLRCMNHHPPHRLGTISKWKRRGVLFLSEKLLRPAAFMAKALGGHLVSKQSDLIGKCTGLVARGWIRNQTSTMGLQLVLINS